MLEDRSLTELTGPERKSLKGMFFFIYICNLTSRHSPERDSSMVWGLVPVPIIAFIFNRKMDK